MPARLLAARALATCLAFAMAIPAATIAMAAEWRETAHAYDVERIETLDAAIAQGNDEAEGHGSGYEQAVAIQFINAPVGTFDDQAAIGAWQCRTIKVGGSLARLVVYDWFKCRITRDSGGLVVEKLTGSQNFKGRLYTDGPNRRILLAGGFYGYEEPRAYQAPDSADGKSPDNRDKVAVAEMLGPDWLRFTFPWPARESTYDIIEFRRDR